MAERSGWRFGGMRLDIFWLAGEAVDFRCGAGRLLTYVREVLGREPLEGSAFVFRNQRANRIKVLVVDAQGVWLATRRLREAVKGTPDSKPTRYSKWGASGRPSWPSTSAPAAAANTRGAS